MDSLTAGFLTFLLIVWAFKALSAKNTDVPVKSADTQTNEEKLTSARSGLADREKRLKEINELIFLEAGTGELEDIDELVEKKRKVEQEIAALKSRVHSLQSKV